jgi:outer membrane protein assembly factor BamB
MMTYRTVNKTISALLFICTATIICDTLHAADWPAYRADTQRSGISGETLQLPLKPQWIHKPAHAPQPAWPEMPAHNDYWHKVHGLTPTNTYDRAFHTVIVDNKLYFGSSADDSLYCLDTFTGKIIWSFTAQAPIRLAPAVAMQKIYLGSDDGCLYCLNAKDGKLLWKYKTTPNEQLCGNGRMISPFPVRSGIIVDDEIVYATCGLFPNKGVYLCAVEAQTGNEIFKTQTDISPQGYMLATPSHLFIPTDRTAPQVFDKATGEKIGPFGAGGTFAVVLNDMLLSGPNERGQITVNNPASRETIVSTPGLRVIAKGPMVYIMKKDSLSALDRKSYIDLSTKIRAIEKIKANQRSPQQKAQLAELRTERDKCLKWETPCSAPYSLIMAGPHLIAGAENKIYIYDAADGKELWAAQTDGKVYSLAVSNARLFAATDKGAIHCFGVGPATAAVITPAKIPSPYLTASDSDIYARTAKRILKDCDLKKGYCLVLGAGNGRLAYEIAKRSDFHIIAVEPDTQKADRAREMLAQAQLYGPRIVIHNRSLDKLPYPKYFANLIISEQTLDTAQITTPPEELFRMLRPCGGILALAYPARLKDKDYLTKWAKNSIPDFNVSRDGNLIYAFAKRAPLEGQGQWTHMYADPANTACSNDTLVRGPVDLQWFGRPGPREMIDRHHRNVPPLYKNGRLFVPGDSVVFAVDAYNGTVQWETRVPNSRRLGVFLDSSNMVVDDNYLYIAAQDKCRLFNVDTGQAAVTHKMPQLIKNTQCHWSYLAHSANILFGSATNKDSSYTETSWDADNALWYHDMKVVTSRYIFAMNPKTGKTLWKFRQGLILNPTITIGPGRMYFVETTSQKAMVDTLGRIPIKTLFDGGEQNLVALDIKTGKLIYRKKLDVSNFEEPVFLNYADGVLLLSGSKLVGNDIIYHVDAFNADNAQRIWNINHNAELPADGAHGEYNRHPTIIGDTAYVWPYAYNLKTGKKIEEWKFDRRGHGCGGVSASAYGLFWRGQNPWMYDLSPNGGPIRLTQVTRPGCWINIIPAGGMILIPEASSGCTCDYSVQTSLAFVPIGNN